jgi:hypothetical protein
MKPKNPFDFANPVTDRTLFAGRAREVAELEYYIDLATSQKAIGLAVVGERTSGKTSLLNMAQLAARDRSFLTIRLDLTKTDVKDEPTFLASLYESTMLAARRQQLWGDKSEEVYQAFRLAMGAGNAAKIREYCDLAFPQTVALSTSTGHQTANFPVALILEDYRNLLESRTWKECSGIALLIDEGDILAEVPSVLEKLRFVMSSPLSMVVVVAGTEQMLGSMDAVFAPIVRQFKRIRLRPFVSPSETRECLLERLRITGDEGALVQITYVELHELAQGSPYEAQLVAHYAYRRYRENPRGGFAISITVLNDVLAEVERFRSQEHDKFASTLRKLSVDELRELSWIVTYPKLTLYEKATLEVALRNPGRVKEIIRQRRQELRGVADRFVQMKLIQYDGTTQSYDIQGGQFDRLYIKYLARSMKVNWREDHRSFLELTEGEIADGIGKAAEARAVPPLIFEGDVSESRPSADEGKPESPLVFTETRFHQVVGKIRHFMRSWQFRSRVRELGARIGEETFSSSDAITPTFLTDLGRVAAHRLPEEGMPTAQVRLESLKGEHATTIWLQPTGSHTLDGGWGETIADVLSRHQVGIEALGWRTELLGVDIEVPLDMKQVLTTCDKLHWDGVKDEVLEALQSTPYRRYENGEAEIAQRYAMLGVQFSSGPLSYIHLNNAGYLRLVAGDASAARALLEKIGESEAPWADLPRYNLAMVKVVQGDNEGARRDLAELHKRITAERVSQTDTFIVHVVVRRNDKSLGIEERRRISLNDAVELSLRVLSPAEERPRPY